MLLLGVVGNAWWGEGLSRAPAAARNYVDADRSRADDYYLVEGTGIALAKLDSSAKGGAVIAIESELGVPVKLAGVGEGIDDLTAFEPEPFVRSLFED